MFVDCTFGRGGHTQALLQRVAPEGQVLALDRDPAAIEHGQQLAGQTEGLSVIHAAFSGLEDVARGHKCYGNVHGVLFDLGVSSPQLDDAGRGFSFSSDGPLDMRMDPGCGVSAAEWLHTATEREIADVLRSLGEERYARRIARRIIERRSSEAISTTAQLAELVTRAAPTREREKHPATRTFQALRIHVNQELDELRTGLQQAIDVLAPGGRVVVISFHSLEDRIVKRYLRSESRTDDGDTRRPPMADMRPPRLRVIGKPVRPSEEEIARNPRARSAILRVAEKRH